LLKIRIGIGKGRETLELLEQRCWKHFFLQLGMLLLAPGRGGG
jgi:hypothetical protein